MKKVIDRASSRGYFNHGWLKTHHTFSFANYYNPERIHFGALRVLNDDSVDPSMGFDTHPHKNMEVISIPLKGYLKHGNTMAVIKNNWNSCRYGYFHELKTPNRSITTSIFVRS